jgi:hypothetical protein
MDSLRVASLGDVAGTSRQTRQAAGRTFIRDQGVWIDGFLLLANMHPAITVRVQAYSPAWFAVVRALPDLKEALALGDRVRIAGKAAVLEVAPDGEASLDATTIAKLSANW